MAVMRNGRRNTIIPDQGITVKGPGVFRQDNAIQTLGAALSLAMSVAERSSQTEQAVYVMQYEDLIYTVSKNELGAVVIAP